MEKFVTIGEIKVTGCPGKLTILGLGSCVGVSLYDPIVKVGGLAHVMLPDSTQFAKVTVPTKFADLAIPTLIEEVTKAGGKKYRFVSKLVGGAQMFTVRDSSVISDIGCRNITSVKDILFRLGIPIKAEKLGGNRGRTMIFDTDDGSVLIRTIGENPCTI